MVVAAKLLGVTGLSRKWENFLMQAASTRASDAWDSPPHRLQSQVLAFLLAKTHGHTPESICISYYCLIFGRPRFSIGLVNLLGLSRQVTVPC